MGGREGIRGCVQIVENIMWNERAPVRLRNRSSSSAVVCTNAAEKSHSNEYV